MPTCRSSRRIWREWWNTQRRCHVWRHFIKQNLQENWAVAPRAVLYCLCVVLCCVVFTHSTADLDGSRHCSHADQPRTGLLDAEAGGRLSQMQSCGLWSPKDGQQPCSPCRNSPRLIYDSLPHIVPGIITALGNVLVFGLF